jgi:hypothetical protein
MLWGQIRSAVDPATGEIVTKCVLNVKGGPSLTLMDGGLLAERSLPKALRGQNIEDLTPADVPDALAVVDAEIAEALPGVQLPPLADWSPSRVDYCRSVRLNDEAEVLRRLDRLASAGLPYKGLPVRGQNHGVRWPKGRVQPKFYGKYLETKGDPRALGVLRSEASVYRLDTFRKFSGLTAPTIADALNVDIHAAVWQPFAEYLRGSALSKQEMNDVEFVRELVAFFGARRSASLIGYCVLFGIAGAKSRQDMLASDILEFRTKYRVMADIRAFRAAMAAKGYVSPTGDAAADDAAVVLHLASLRTAAA